MQLLRRLAGGKSIGRTGMAYRGSVCAGVRRALAGPGYLVLKAYTRLTAL